MATGKRIRNPWRTALADRMLARLLIAVVVLTTWSSQALAQTVAVTTSGGPTVQEAQQAPALGPKARVAVAQFKDKTGKGWWTGAIGDGMADMLATTLFNTNRFIVLERSTLKDIVLEQDLGASGRIKKETAAPVGEIEGAELLIVGAVTEFEPGSQGVRGGTGGGGWLGIGSAIIGGVAGGYKASHLALDMRLVDAKTSRVVAATSVEGKARDFDLGGAIGGIGGVGMGGALSVWSKTPMEKALRIALNEAVKFISAQTPSEYYRAPAAALALAAPTMAPTLMPRPSITAIVPAAPQASGSISGPAGMKSTEDRLLKLEELRKKGLLADDEYKKKREEILKDI
jgi:curli biogenesis system outer membrane secretion channel CsgG